MTVNWVIKCTNTTYNLLKPILSTAHVSYREVNTVQSDISFTLLSAALTQSQPTQTHFCIWRHNRNLYSPISLPSSAHTLIKIYFFSEDPQSFASFLSSFWKQTENVSYCCDFLWRYTLVALNMVIFPELSHESGLRIGELHGSKHRCITFMMRWSPYIPEADGLFLKSNLIWGRAFSCKMPDRGLSLGSMVWTSSEAWKRFISLFFYSLAPHRVWGWYWLFSLYHIISLTDSDQFQKCH